MNWPLAVPSMTALHKLKIGYWLLTEKHWSAGETVREYERRWEGYTGSPHAIMVHSGSAANFLIAQRCKVEMERLGVWEKNRRVLFPAVNWISSISPWVQQGFEPVFMDVSSNMCSSSDQVAAAIAKHNPAVLFYTTLLGFSGNLQAISDICEKAGIWFYLDNCESSFSSYDARHFCEWTTSSTSLYFSHHTSGNQEGGLIFCKDDEEANWYRMARNHGMTRGMPKNLRNPDVDPRFDFALMGSNHRSTNLAAYMASLDFDRALAFDWQRRFLSRTFSELLDGNVYEKPHQSSREFSPLALPIVTRSMNIERVKNLLDREGVESRPIVGGNILRHTAFGRQEEAKEYRRAQHFHNNGVYIGLHKGVTIEMVKELTGKLNDL